MSNKIKKSNKLKCKKSFKANMLTGGFTKGNHYEILKVTKDEVYILDDDNLEYDPMDLSYSEVEEYFEV